jgi:hypothetical protein
MIWMHLNQGLCCVELQVEVTGRSEISNQDYRVLQAEVEEMRRKSLFRVADVYSGCWRNQLFLAERGRGFLWG